MKSEHTPQSLAAFTERVRQAFADKLIHAPVHLCGGNEVQVIEAFKDVRPGDWVFSGWRSAYHALLKGIPEEWVYGEIVAGRSMYLMSAEHRLRDALTQLSTDTPTAAAWGGHTECRSNKVRIDRYSYERAVPHVGIGQHVQF